MVSYFVNQKDHPSHNDGSKLSCEIDKMVLLTFIILGFFTIKSIFFNSDILMLHSYLNL
jgi:hypothetical protein